MSSTVSLSILGLLEFWFLVTVHSHDVPYITFLGEFLANHSYVNVSLLQQAYGLQCHSDRDGCCEGSPYRGYWYSPAGDTLPSLAQADNVYHLGNDRRAELRRRNEPVSPSPEGIYCCEVPTYQSESERAYVGLYSSGGDIMVSRNVRMTVESDLNGASPRFTLTCVSTGGPATTVTWTRDSATVTEVTETVLNNPVTAHYTHTLNVTGRLGGLYTCTIQNNKPSIDSAQITVKEVTVPTDVAAVQNGPTTVIVSWSPSSDATGYRINYDSSGGGSGSEDVSGGATANHTLTGLENGETYIILIFAKSPMLPSASFTTRIRLVTIPEMPVINMDAIRTTATTIFIFWGVPADVSHSEVVWTPAASGGGDATTSGRLSAATNSFEITDLRSSTSYLISLTIFNPAGHSSTNLTQSTTAGPEFGSGLSTAAVGGIVVTVVAVICLVIVVVVILLLVARCRSKADEPTRRSVDVPHDRIRPNEAYSEIAEQTYYETIFDLPPANTPSPQPAAVHSPGHSLGLGEMQRS